MTVFTKIIPPIQFRKWRSGGFKKSHNSMTPPVFGKPCFITGGPPDPYNGGESHNKRRDCAATNIVCGFDAPACITVMWDF